MPQAARVDQGFTRIGEAISPIVVPEHEERALSTGIQAQLAGLPTAITDPETYRRAKESLPLLKQAEDKVVAFFRDIKEHAYRAHKAITAKESAQLTPITGARSSLSRLIYGYEQEQQRRRREQERREAEAEQQRLQQQALEEAAALETTAPEMAKQIVEQAIAAPAPVVVLPSTAVDVVGVGSRENWTWTYLGMGTKADGSPRRWKDLTDAERQQVMKFLPREYLEPSEAAIGKVVKALKSATKIPGVSPVDVGTVSVRG